MFASHRPFGTRFVSASLTALLASVASGQGPKPSEVAFSLDGYVNGDFTDEVIVLNDEIVHVAGSLTAGAYSIQHRNGFGVLVQSTAFAPAHQIVEIHAIGDVNGDGADDYVLAYPWVSQGPWQSAGLVEVRSGVTDDVIGTYAGSLEYVLGQGIADAGDQNGDGFDEVFIGAPRITGAFGSPFVECRDFANNTTLWKATGPVGSQLGWSLDSCDLNGDGRLDAVAGAPLLNGGTGDIRGFDGTNGSPIYTSFTGAPPGGELGRFVATLPDQDGDGKCEIFAGAPAANTHRGAALLRLSSSSNVLTHQGSAPGDQCGISGGWVDEFAKLLVNSQMADNSGRCQVLDPADMSVDWTAQGSAEDYLAAVALARTPTCQNGLLLLVTQPGFDPRGNNEGRLRGYQLGGRTFYADRSQIGVAEGGTQNLYTELGAAHAGHSYVTFGALRPGCTPLGSTGLPLTPGPYTSLSLIAATPASTGWIARSAGTLGSIGDAQGQLTLLPGQLPASAAGLSMYHTTLAFGSGGFHAAAATPTILASW